MNTKTVQTHEGETLEVVEVRTNFIKVGDVVVIDAYNLTVTEVLPAGYGYNARSTYLVFDENPKFKWGYQQANASLIAKAVR